MYSTNKVVVLKIMFRVRVNSKETPLPNYPPTTTNTANSAMKVAATKAPVSHIIGVAHVRVAWPGMRYTAAPRYLLISEYSSV